MWFSVACILIDGECASSQWSKCIGHTTNSDHCDDAYSLLIRVQSMLNHIRYAFYYNINLCQDLLTIENSDLKVRVLHYADELLVRVRLSFQKLLQTCSTWRTNKKKMFGKRVMTRTRCRSEDRPR